MSIVKSFNVDGKETGRTTARGGAPGKPSVSGTAKVSTQIMRREAISQRPRKYEFGLTSKSTESEQHAIYRVYNL